MLRMTNIITLGGLKNKIIQIVGTSFTPKPKNLTFLYYSKKPVDIVFEQTIDNIEKVNRNYVTP